jgi:hypothetical protein
MRMLELAALAALVAIAVPQARAEDEAALKIVNAGIKAHGGEEALKKNKAGDYKMKGSMTVLGTDLEYTGTLTYQLPDQFKMTIDTSLMGQKLAIVQIGNGDKFKTTLNGQAQKLDDKTKDELRQGASSQEISMLYPLLDKEKYTIKSGKDAKIAGVECSTVLVEGKKTKPMKLYFDKKTGLLHATNRKAIAPGAGDEVEEETVMSEYKEVEGIKIPMKLVVTHDGKTFMTTTFTDAKLSAKLDPKLFGIDD